MPRTARPQTVSSPTSCASATGETSEAGLITTGFRGQTNTAGTSCILLKTPDDRCRRSAGRADAVVAPLARFTALDAQRQPSGARIWLR